MAVQPSQRSLVLKIVLWAAMAILGGVCLSLTFGILKASGSFWRGSVAEDEEVLRAEEKKRIEQLVKQLPDMPYGPVHGGYTPAAEELIDLGPRVLPYMFNVVTSEESDPLSRSAAVVVVSEIARDLCNDAPKNVFTAEEERRWDALWRDMGNLYEGDSLEQRMNSVEKWRVWLAARESNSRKLNTEGAKVRSSRRASQ